MVYFLTKSIIGTVKISLLFCKEILYLYQNPLFFFLLNSAPETEIFYCLQDFPQVLQRLHPKVKSNKPTIQLS